MTDSENLRNPWLVAVWPGMGHVALGAGTYLVNKLGAELSGEVSARELFDVEHVEVKDGITSAGQMPRNLFLTWRNPHAERDLLIFVGEAQPSFGRYAFCHKLLDYAQQRGVRRVCTFAAMATQLHPSAPPRVFGVGTGKPLVEELRRLEVDILEEGQISGLNGVLLAAAAERGLDGVCLLGELPFFAVGVRNPKASRAVLEAFTSMAGVQIDMAELDEQAEAVEGQLLQLLEELGESGEIPGMGGEVPGLAEAGGAEEPESSEPEEPTLDIETRQRIEWLFEQARRDRSRAFELKRELDRLGVFKRYEDRFLDLFKKAE